MPDVYDLVLGICKDGRSWYKSCTFLIHFKEMFELWSADKIMMPFISQLNEDVTYVSKISNLSDLIWNTGRWMKIKVNFHQPINR